MRWSAPLTLLLALPLMLTAQTSPSDAVRAAFQMVAANLRKHHPEVVFEGVTVQPMVRDKGYELMAPVAAAAIGQALTK